MVVSRITNGLAYLVMSRASSLPAFAILMSITGAVNPLYRVGGDAMLADLIPPDQRADAYALLRLSNNVGVAIGPAVGGVLIAASYSIAFYCAAAGMITYGLILALFARETLPAGVSRARVESLGGYDKIAHDRRFMPFVGALTLTQMCATLMWVLMAVHAKRHYHVPENLYGLIPTTNALMVVFFQVVVTQVTKRHPPLKMMTAGRAVLCVGRGQRVAGARLLGVLAEHGHHDRRRVDPHAHLVHVCGRPGARRYARTLHEHLWPHLAGGSGHRACGGRLLGRHVWTGHHLVWRAGRGAAVRRVVHCAASPRSIWQRSMVLTPQPSPLPKGQGRELAPLSCSPPAKQEELEGSCSKKPLPSARGLLNPSARITRCLFRRARQVVQRNRRDKGQNG